MSKPLQWVLGVCAVVVALAILLAVVGPWILPWSFGGRYGSGMTQAPAPWAGVGGYGPGSTGGYGPGMMGGYGSGMMGGGYGSGMMGGGYGSGMMGGPGRGSPFGSGTRLTIDQARTLAETYASNVNSDLSIAEVMEFENNFYAALEESSTGRGAMEILVDPYTGTVGPEPGPNMMWNDKYGHMSFGNGGDNAITMDEARAAAQQALEAQLPGSTVHQDGTSFYGYYTFDFDGSDGKIAGMLSVEATGGSVWLHTWHGDFVRSGRRRSRLVKALRLSRRPCPWSPPSSSAGLLRSACGSSPSGRADGSRLAVPKLQSAPVVVRQAYAFAHDHADVLPASRATAAVAPSGTPRTTPATSPGRTRTEAITYDLHAVGCSICVDITQDAQRMLDEGRSIGGDSRRHQFHLCRATARRTCPRSRVRPATALRTSVAPGPDRAGGAGRHLRSVAAADGAVHVRGSSASKPETSRSTPPS